jgi:hypothetical protein
VSILIHGSVMIIIIKKAFPIVVVVVTHMNEATSRSLPPSQKEAIVQRVRDQVILIVGRYNQAFDSAKETELPPHAKGAAILFSLLFWMLVVFSFLWSSAKPDDNWLRLLAAAFCVSVLLSCLIHTTNNTRTISEGGVLSDSIDSIIRNADQAGRYAYSHHGTRLSLQCLQSEGTHIVSTLYDSLALDAEWATKPTSQIFFNDLLVLTVAKVKANTIMENTSKEVRITIDKGPEKSD